MWEFADISISGAKISKGGTALFTHSVMSLRTKRCHNGIQSTQCVCALMMKGPLEPGLAGRVGSFPRSLRVVDTRNALACTVPHQRSSTMPRSTPTTSLDKMLDILRSSHRRRILVALQDHNPRDEDELAADSIASDDATDDDLEQLKIQLHHTHFPKLAAAGYIEWDPDTETIRRGPNFDDVAPLLMLMADHADELPDDWP